MAGSFSNFLELELLDHTMGNGSWSAPTDLYIAFSTADPTEDGSGIAEPSGSNYSRTAFNSWTASGRAASNSSAFVSPIASGSWGTISHWAMYDASTSGNMLIHGSLDTPRTIGSGSALAAAIGELDIVLATGGISNYLAEAWLKHVLKITSYSVPANRYLALSTANPTDDGSGAAEPSGNNYARIVANDWGAAAAGAIANDADITFATASGAWGLITHQAMYDALTVGNMLFYGAVSPNQTPVNLSVLKWLTGGYTVSLN